MLKVAGLYEPVRGLYLQGIQLDHRLGYVDVRDGGCMYGTYSALSAVRVGLQVSPEAPPEWHSVESVLEMLLSGVLIDGFEAEYAMGGSLLSLRAGVVKVGASEIEVARYHGIDVTLDGVLGVVDRSFCNNGVVVLPGYVAGLDPMRKTFDPYVVAATTLSIHSNYPAKNPKWSDEVRMLKAVSMNRMDTVVINGDVSISPVDFDLLRCNITVLGRMKSGGFKGFMRGAGRLAKVGIFREGGYPVAPHERKQYVLRDNFRTAVLDMANFKIHVK